MIELPAAWRGVRAISFDLDYTLWDLAGVIEQAEQTAHDYLARYYPRVAERYGSARQLVEKRLQLLERQPQLRHNVTAWRREALAELARECGYQQRLVDEAFDVFLEARHRIVPYQDALPVLGYLRRHYTLGVITNGNADVHRLGLGHYFDFVVSAVDIGSAKPDHLIFEAACHRAGVAPAQMLHIGDEPHCDVYGAARYGMQAVWLNRHGRVWPPELDRVPHVEIDSLQALAALPGPLSRCSAVDGPG